jgi:hypothetical protein
MIEDFLIMIGVIVGFYVTTNVLFYVVDKFFDWLEDC